MSDQSKKTKLKRWRHKRSHLRSRKRIEGTQERPRLAVFKSLRFIYAQVIDDSKGQTLAQASSMDPEIRGQIKGNAGNVEAAKLVGKAIAERAKGQGIESVVFDRGGYIYHGKIRAIAEAARESGLQF